jgi:hypothetical protein
MPLMKHVVGANGVGTSVPMTTEEEALFLASQPYTPPVPAIISRFQGLAALASLGKLDAANAAVAAHANPVVPIAWANVQEFRRDSEMLAEMAAVIDVDLDEVFTLGAQIVL